MTRRTPGRDGAAVTAVDDADYYVCGPAPFMAKDRSRFLSKLDETLHAIRRAAGQGCKTTP